MIDTKALELELKKIKKDVADMENEINVKFRKDIGDIKRQVKKIGKQIR